MLFSLILATINRTNELEELFHSLTKQDYNHFEVIVIDQNSHNSVEDICNNFSTKINIQYFKVKFRGLSKARNFGLQFASGNIIAFPDDDCVYSNDVLSIANNLFLNIDIDILTGDTSDYISKKKYLKTEKLDTIISFNNVFRSAISYTIFIKYKQKYDLIFDEKLGVGAQFGSAEETDLIIKLLKLNYNGFYTPRIMVFHPFSRTNNIDRNYNYALGFGAVHKKHFDLFPIKLHYIIFAFISFLKIIFFVNPKLNYNILKAKIIGFLQYD